MHPTIMPSDSRLLRILVVHHYPVFAEALAFVFRQQLPCTEVVVVPSVVEARDILQDIDIALIDFDTFDDHGVNFGRELRRMTKTCVVLGLANSASMTPVEVASDARVVAIINKTVPIAELVERVRQVVIADTVFAYDGVNGHGDALKSRVYDAIPDLTLRERQLLQALVEGLHDREIAVRLMSGRKRCVNI